MSGSRSLKKNDRTSVIHDDGWEHPSPSTGDEMIQQAHEMVLAKRWVTASGAAMFKLEHLQEN